MDNLTTIASNIADEAMAVEGYIPLLKDKQISGTISEIIGDELAHLLMLVAILVESGGFKIAPDLKNALDIIKGHIGE